MDSLLTVLITQILLQLFTEFSIAKFLELYFFLFYSILFLQALRSSNVRNLINCYLKEVHRFQVIFENAPTQIGYCSVSGNYISNFSVFSSSICGSRSRENLSVVGCSVYLWRNIIQSYGLCNGFFCLKQLPLEFLFASEKKN